MNVSGKCNILSIYVHTQAQSFDKSLHEIRKGFVHQQAFITFMQIHMYIGEFVFFSDACISVAKLHDFCTICGIFSPQARLKN